MSFLVAGVQSCRATFLDDLSLISEKTADVAQRASAIYEEKLRSHLEATKLHAFVAIEPDSGDYFVGQT